MGVLSSRVVKDEAFIVSRSTDEGSGSEQWIKYSNRKLKDSGINLKSPSEDPLSEEVEFTMNVGNAIGYNLSGMQGQIREVLSEIGEKNFR